MHLVCVSAAALTDHQEGHGEVFAPARLHGSQHGADHSTDDPDDGDQDDEPPDGDRPRHHHATAGLGLLLWCVMLSARRSADKVHKNALVGVVRRLHHGSLLGVWSIVSKS